jgi:hypothetical protein
MEGTDAVAGHGHFTPTVRRSLGGGIATDHDRSEDCDGGQRMTA